MIKLIVTTTEVWAGPLSRWRDTSSPNLIVFSAIRHRSEVSIVEFCDRFAILKGDVLVDHTLWIWENSVNYFFGRIRRPGILRSKFARQIFHSWNDQRCLFNILLSQLFHAALIGGMLIRDLGISPRNIYFRTGFACLRFYGNQ